MNTDDVELFNKITDEIKKAKSSLAAISPLDIEKNFVDSKKIDYEIAKKKLEYEKFKDDNDGRKSVKEWVLIVSSLWMFFVLMIIVAVGKGSLRLSDNVLITIITTTTANVLGLMYIIANYLFNKDKST